MKGPGFFVGATEYGRHDVPWLCAAFPAFSSIAGHLACGERATSLLWFLGYDLHATTAGQRFISLLPVVLQVDSNRCDRRSTALVSGLQQNLQKSLFSKTG
jgi:hypothetical protein